MVSSGKGGVGKSTTSVNLAVALAMQGKKVGLLDADIYGPNIPRMVGLENEKPEIVGNKVIPFNAYGIEMMSMGSLIDQGQALNVERSNGYESYYSTTTRYCLG